MIHDLYGRPLEVTDLEAALKQAENFSGYTTDEPAQKAFARNRSAYWKDIYLKLRQLAKTS